MTKPKLFPLFFSALLLSLAPVLSVQGSQVILLDDFSTGHRNVQNPPNQSAWFAAGPGNRLFADAADGGSLTLNQVNSGGANTGALTYFTNAGAMELPPGGSLTVRFDFQVSGVFDSGDNRLWVGLFNSHGSRLVQDEEVTAAGVSPGNRFMQLDKFAPYTGYEAAFNIDRNPAWESKTDSTNSRIYRRPDNANERIFTTSGAAGLGTADPEEMRQVYLMDDTLYRLEFTVERFTMADQIRATLTLTGGNLPPGGQTMTGTDPQMVENSFDTFGIWQSRFVTSEATFSGELVLQNFEVAYVPEPSTQALIFAVFAMAAAAVSRLRRRTRL